MKFYFDYYKLYYSAVPRKISKYASVAHGNVSLFSIFLPVRHRTSSYVFRESVYDSKTTAAGFGQHHTSTGCARFAVIRRDNRKQRDRIRTGTVPRTAVGPAQTSESPVLFRRENTYRRLSRTAFPPTI